MSNLLADLALDYEQLFNDPIELGIHYGHSILNYFTPDFYTKNGTNQNISRRFSRFIDKKRNIFVKPEQIESFRQTSTQDIPVIKRQPLSIREKVYYQKRPPLSSSRDLSFSIDSSRYRTARSVESRSPQLIGQV